jgi:chromosome segregation ATPase
MVRFAGDWQRRHEEAVARLGADQAQSQQRGTDLERERDQLRTELATLKAAHAEDEQRYQDDLKRLAATMQQRYADLVDRLTADLTEAQETIARLQQKQADEERGRDQQQSQALLEARAAEERVRSEFESYKREMDMNRREHDLRLRRNVELFERNRTLQEDLHRQEHRIAELEEHVAALQHQLATRPPATPSEQDALEAERQRWLTDWENREQQCAAERGQLQHEMEEAHWQSNQLREQVSALQELVQKLRQQEAEQEKALAALQVQLTAQTAAAARSDSATVGDLYFANHGWADERAALEQRFAEERDLLTSHITQLRWEIDSLRNTLQMAGVHV